MDEEELEQWYDDQSQELTEKYNEDMKEGKDSDKLKIWFDKKWNKLNDDYKKKSLDIERRKVKIKERKEFYKKHFGPIVRFKTKLFDIFKTIYKICSRGFSYNFSVIKMKLRIFWTLNSYKPQDYYRRHKKPYYKIYVWLFLPIILAIKKPLKHLKEYTIRKAIENKEKTIKNAEIVWKYTKIVAKFIAKISVAVFKFVNDKITAVNKKIAAIKAKIKKKIVDTKNKIIEKIKEKIISIFKKKEESKEEGKEGEGKEGESKEGESKEGESEEGEGKN